MEHGNAITFPPLEMICVDGRWKHALPTEQIIENFRPYEAVWTASTIGVNAPDALKAMHAAWPERPLCHYFNTPRYKSQDGSSALTDEQFAEHPEWILHDSDGKMIPYPLDKGSKSEAYYIDVTNRECVQAAVENAVRCATTYEGITHLAADMCIASVERIRHISNVHDWQYKGRERYFAMRYADYMVVLKNALKAEEIALVANVSTSPTHPDDYQIRAALPRCADVVLSERPIDGDATTAIRYWSWLKHEGVKTWWRVKPRSESELFDYLGMACAAYVNYFTDRSGRFGELWEIMTP